MKESCSGKRRRYDGGGLLPVTRKICCRTRLIVVLKKAQKFVLVCKGGREMELNTLRVAMFQPVIEPLVVAEVEPLALQLILQVQVSFGDEVEIRICALNRGYHFIPVLIR